jgi:hypothetical protein
LTEVRSRKLGKMDLVTRDAFSPYTYRMQEAFGGFDNHACHRMANGQQGRSWRESRQAIVTELLLRAHYVPRSPARTARWELELWWLEQEFRSVPLHRAGKHASPAFWHMFAYRNKSAGTCKAPDPRASKVHSAAGRQHEKAGVRSPLDGPVVAIAGPANLILVAFS